MDKYLTSYINNVSNKFNHPFNVFNAMKNTISHVNHVALYIIIVEYVMKINTLPIIPQKSGIFNILLNIFLVYNIYSRPDVKVKPALMRYIVADSLKRMFYLLFGLPLIKSNSSSV